MNWLKLLGEVSSIRVKSVTDALFRYGMGFALLGGAAAGIKAPMAVWVFMLVASGLLLMLGLCFYIYFALKKPDYLRSESFQIRKQSLEMLGDDKNRLNPNMGRVIPIANPQATDAGTARLGENRDDEA